MTQQTIQTSTLSWETAEQARVLMEKITDAVYNLARDDAGKRMGDSAWLRYAMQESDIILSEVNDKFVYVYGHAFTTQTQGTEWFEFQIATNEVFEYIARNDS